MRGNSALREALLRVYDDEAALSSVLPGNCSASNCLDIETFYNTIRCERIIPKEGATSWRGPGGPLPLLSVTCSLSERSRVPVANCTLELGLSTSHTERKAFAVMVFSVC